MKRSQRQIDRLIAGETTREEIHAACPNLSPLEIDLELAYRQELAALDERRAVKERAREELAQQHPDWSDVDLDAELWRLEHPERHERAVQERRDAMRLVAPGSPEVPDPGAMARYCALFLSPGPS